MSDTVTLVGQGGAETVFSLPLSENSVNQVANGQIVPKTNKDRLKLKGESEPAPEPEPEESEVSSDVPDGTVADVLEWVDGDPERAAEALAVEEASEHPRSTLIASLSDLIGG